MEPGYLRAARDFYDTIAFDYAARYQDELTAKPYDRAILAAYADLIQGGRAGPAGPDRADGPDGLVADVGCGPGRVTAHLRSLGVRVFGVDLSPVMADLARRTYPDLNFHVGSMTRLALADQALAGVVAWYSIIHLPPRLVPEALAEFHRVLAPGGRLLLAFQVGDAPLRLEQPLGHPVSLDFRRLQPEHVAELLAQAGFAVEARLVREPGPGESVPQAYVVAVKLT